MSVTYTTEEILAYTREQLIESVGKQYSTLDINKLRLLLVSNMKLFISNKY